MKNRSGMVISYMASIASILMGLNKMFVYSNPEYSYADPKNVYVGGDAYNYIINANFSTAWFVLAGVFAIIGLTFLIAGYLSPDEVIELKEGIETIPSDENLAV